MKRRDVLVLGLATLSAPSMLSPARAQSRYPDRPIRLVIPFTTGGVNDAVGRPWADKMKTLLGTVVVENIGGAGGGLGAAAVGLMFVIRRLSRIGCPRRSGGGPAGPSCGSSAGRRAGG